MSRNEQKSSKALLLGLLLVALVGLFAGRHEIRRALQREDTPIELPLTAATALPLISPEDAFQKWLSDKEVTFVDLRSFDAFALLHIPRSRSITLSDLATIQTINGKPLILVFSSSDEGGATAAHGILDQRSLSYFFLEGGFEQWVTGGKPTFSIGDPHSLVDQSKVTYLPAADLRTFLEAHTSVVQFLDVREASAFRKHHVKGALNIPLDTIEFSETELPPGRTIIVYGAHEVEAFRGAVHLFDMGIITTRALRGSFDDLVRLGIATVSE